jgi:hypothetical protein
MIGQRFVCLPALGISLRMHTLCHST